LGAAVFSWDETKNATNQTKHGISFELARQVFDDPLHLTRQDRMEHGEQRWQTLGMVGAVVLILVAHTWHDSDGEESIRIISARRATKQERKIYEQGN
jgi:uncharacterized DUF497 family protein